MICPADFITPLISARHRATVLTASRLKVVDFAQRFLKNLMLAAKHGATTADVFDQMRTHLTIQHNVLTPLTAPISPLPRAPGVTSLDG